MAIMIPEQVKKFAHPLEEKVFYKLKENLSNDYTVIYEPSVGIDRERKPDFIIISRRHGIFVLDVKSQDLEKIKSANPHQIELENGEVIKNFLKTVDDYQYALINQLKRDLKHNPHIVHQEGSHKGKLKFPVLSGIILDVPNKGYTKEEIAQRLALSPLNCFILFSEIDTIESFLKRGLYF